MYGDVNVTVEDGNLGRSSSTGSGVQFKIGISNIESATPILITGSMDAKKIKEKVGNTPLADACIDSVENGAATIYCIRAAFRRTVNGIFPEQAYADHNSECKDGVPGVCKLLRGLLSEDGWKMAA